jgi:hypothetical protein
MIPVLAMWMQVIDINIFYRSLADRTHPTGATLLALQQMRRHTGTHWRGKLLLTAVSSTPIGGFGPGFAPRANFLCACEGLTKTLKI